MLTLLLVNKIFADIGYIITYTVTLSNTGNSTTDNIVFIDAIQNSTNFVSNTVIVNGISQPCPNPQSDILVGSITCITTATISYKVIVVCS